MADDPTKAAVDRKRIDVSEVYVSRYWAERFGVTPTRLKQVVAQVGVMVEDVERELRRA